jgi:hypothetical protein
MLSPVKAITAGALVFVLGGAFLIAQPFGQPSSVPGAATETGWAENTPFTLKFVWYDRNVRDGEAVTEGGITKVLGSCNAMGIADPSDPRLDGSLTWCTDEHDYGAVRDESTVVWTDTYRIVNDEGAWQGSTSGAMWDDPVSGERMEPGGDPIILVGEGAYEGLYAAITGPFSDTHGVIFEGAPPADPVPPTAE